MRFNKSLFIISSILLLQLWFVTCCIAKRPLTGVANPIHITISSLQPRPVVTKDGRILIKRHYNLKGRELVLPANRIIDFQGGYFSNGYIRGNDTKMIYRDKPVFDMVGITGSWLVDSISTDMFKTLKYEGSLVDVLALTNENTKNVVTIKDYGYDYIVKAPSNDGYKAALYLNSNTDFRLNGNIRLKPNDFYQYRILMLNSCHNVKISGMGMISGDRPDHIYTVDDAHKIFKSHEWGHGIKVSGSNNVEISGITVKNCTGDSYSVGEGSSNVYIHDAAAESSRRQGLTIAVASNVTVRNCKFFNIGKLNGTEPGAAIDVEPDEGECEIRNIQIENCEMQNCRKGVLSYSKGYGTSYTGEVNGKKVQKREGRHYLNITIRNCKISGATTGFYLVGWDQGKIENCEVTDTKNLFASIANLSFSGNKCVCERLFHDRFDVFTNSELTDNEIALSTDARFILDNTIVRNNRISAPKLVFDNPDKKINVVTGNVFLTENSIAKIVSTNSKVSNNVFLQRAQ